MIPKERRIGRELVGLVVKTGRPIDSRYFFTRFLYKSGVFGVAVSVSKKVCKRAVDRNRLRRRVYSILAKEAQGKNKLIVFSAKKEAPTLRREFLRKELVNILKKI